MSRSYNISAVACALCVSETAVIEKLGNCKNGLSLSQVLALSEDTKLKKFTEEANTIRVIVEQIQNLEAEAVK